MHRFHLSRARAIITFFALTLAALLAVPANAAPGTLDRIRERGVVHLGYRVSSVPFSYVLPDGQVVGYAHAFALGIVEAIRKHLGLAHLGIELVPITSQNRFLLIDGGSIDLECGSTTHNREREQFASFSSTFFIAGTRMMVRTDSPIRGFKDLGAVRVVTTAGTTSEQLLRRLNNQQPEPAIIISAGDHHDAFLALQAGRATAFVMDDALLYGERAKAHTPQQWRITGEPQSFEAYACMLKRNDDAFKAVVDQAITKMMRSGEAESLYAKWFTQAIPPHGINLEFPLSDTMRTLFRKPNDRPLD
ncbi:transporter substrate-binding domain-containing protein [Parazoarcus communis]|uniref:Amino acid ABC transporter substrate-binding protein n=1 Tax=Parazoarcus communis SWub3 = DSM 12120 TaxID=1121029 RepID=A0A323V1A8_9RHOO|nr:transporter substrate-binding domain-containing protein [Parazoarcus communis]NMG69373.1 transporter substrate-binding domain-containing protein [Parazoarcus communis SWub3 = DSM 12120]PZA18609.1 amino acid ABC transporter substrate-binding protein [Azoarcus communis] [Parazoarcus communis SWub3 = DSM 12120]